MGDMPNALHCRVAAIDVDWAGGHMRGYGNAGVNGDMSHALHCRAAAIDR